MQTVINALLLWGVRWAFQEPEESDLDPLLLMWWMRGRVCFDQLPAQRIVVRFDFTGAKSESYWLLLTRDDASICLTNPGFDLDVLVTADLAAFFQIWMGRLLFADGLKRGQVQIDALPVYIDGFPTWFAYSLAAPAVSAVSVA